MRTNLRTDYKGNSKRIEKKLTKYKEKGFVEAQFNYEKEVANKLN